MKTVHFMHGFIGFGKSTVAKKLEQELLAVRLNNDDWMIILYGRENHKEKHNEYWLNINTLHWNLARNIIRCGGDVIMDNGMWDKKTRIEWTTRALEFADSVVFHAVQCDMQTARNRVIKRSIENNGELAITGDIFDGCATRFEPMTSDEFSDPHVKIIFYDNSKDKQL